VFFSVRDLELRKVRFDVSIPPGQIEYLEKLRQVSNLEAEGVAELLSNTLGEIRVKGRLKVLMQADCDRCLEPAESPVDSEFDLFYRPEPEMKGRHPGEEVAINEGETEIAFYEGAGLELNDILREHIILTLPMQYVCSEACKGICPVCGKDRNQADCGCREQLVDERWAALKNLKK
jgi:uncharacterized protein